MSKKRSTIVVLFAVFAAVFAFSSPAMADAPKFHSAASSVDNAGALVVAWDERGLGNTNIDYTVTAHATALFACINGGGNHPSATNKETVNAEVSAAGSFEPKNGRVVADLSAGPPSAGGFNCPNGQKLVLANVTYSNIVLTDTSNGVTTSVPDASRVFFAV